MIDEKKEQYEYIENPPGLGIPESEEILNEDQSPTESEKKTVRKVQTEINKEG